MTAALMHHALERAAARFGDRDAVLAGDQRWSFRDLDDASTAFGRHLAALGVRPGDRVATMTANRPEFVVAIHGISKIGAAAVLLSPAWKAGGGASRARRSPHPSTRSPTGRPPPCSPDAWARTG